MRFRSPKCYNTIVNAEELILDTWTARVFFAKLPTCDIEEGMKEEMTPIKEAE